MHSKAAKISNFPKSSLLSLLPIPHCCYNGSMSDGDGVGGDLSDELKKTGQSLVSQVTGSDPNSQGGATLDPSDQIGGFGKSILGQVTGSSPGGGQSQVQDVSDQIGGFGKSILGQVTGGDTAGEVVSTARTPQGDGFWGEMKAFGASILGQVSGKDLAEMKKKDDEFSEVSQAEVKAKIARIYQEHAQKRKQEGQHVEQQQKQTEDQRTEIKKEQKKEQMDVSVAQTRANAEIKNMGAE